MLRSITTIIFLFAFMCSFSQSSQMTKKERKRLLKECQKKGDTYITLDDKQIDFKTFINLPDSITNITPFESLDKDSIDTSKQIHINAVTTQYLDSIHIANRKGIIRGYRVNEINTFFYKNNPLILYGNRRITRDEYYELDEADVAFVNFYLSDFVKEYYGTEAKHGIVFVCPRAKKSSIKYTDALPLPANGRNYMDDFGRVWGGWLTDNNGMDISHRYIQTKMQEYNDSIAFGTHAVVVVSCIVHTDGTIEPNIIENIYDANEQALLQKDKLIQFSKEIITSMPKWEPAFEMLYERYLNDAVMSYREKSVSLSVRFKKE